MSPTVKAKKTSRDDNRRTLALIRPDALRHHKGTQYARFIVCLLATTRYNKSIRPLYDTKLIAIVFFPDEILEKVKEAGFSIAMAKEVTLTREEAEDFYAEHRGKDFFETLVTNMCRYLFEIDNSTEHISHRGLTRY